MDAFPGHTPYSNLGRARRRELHGWPRGGFTDATIGFVQALAILFGASFTAAVATALGTLLLGRDPRDLPARFVTGGALLSIAVFCLCALRLAYPAVFVGVGAAALWSAGRPRWSRPELPKSRLLLGAFSLYLMLYFFNAMAPEISFDGSRYHLGLVARYLRVHGFERITNNMYAGLSQGVEMLYLFAFAFGRHSAASMVHLVFLLALVWGMWDYARRSGWGIAGAAGCLLVFASPLVGVDASSAYNDVAVAAIAFTLFAVLERWRDQPSTRLLIAAGLLAGFGFAAKYTAWPGLVYACAVPLFSRGVPSRFRQTALAAAAASVLVLPWMAKNYIWLHNPVSPFFNQWFPNQYITASFENEYQHHMAWYSLTSRWQIPMQVTTYGSLAGLLGPVFLLSPVALLALRWREGRHLLLAGAFFAATYFSNISARFLLPSLPFVALALAMVLSRIPRLALAVALLHAVLSWPSVIPQYSHPDAWHLFKVPYREALRIKPEDGFLQSNLPLYGATRMVERFAAPGSTVFTNTPIPEAYTSRNIVVGFQSAEGVVSRAIFWSGFIPAAAPTWRWRFAVARQPLRGVRLVQLGTGPDSWSINELRILDGPRELPRDARWKLNANPYPWGIENAFDGRAITFWLCGDTLRPGQTVSVEFPQPAFPQPPMADAVVMETAPDQPALRLKLEGLDSDGRWNLLSIDPQIDDVPAPPDLRREAARELKRRGIDYLLLFDGEPGAEDLRENANLWGVRKVGEFQGASLYRLP